MALDPTARESNFRDSIKKFFADNMYTIERIPISFDRTLSSPKLTGQPKRVSKWIVIDFGPFELGKPLAVASITVICCTRGDAEGFILAQTRDKVVGYLTATESITLYRSYENQAWTELGKMSVFVGQESPMMEGPDDTKFKRIPVELKWGCKI